MKSNRLILILIGILFVSELAVAQQESSTADSENMLKMAQQVSSSTGRPIFAVAGRST